MCLSLLDNFCSRWREWIRPLLIIVYVLFVIIVVPLLIVNSVKDGFSRRDQLLLIGGLFVICAIPISIWQITQHVLHYTKPALQKHIIRVLWMVPIYALNAWLCLIVPEHAIYMDSIRECYEAYVIYNFMKYLLNYLNLEMDLEATLEYKPPVKHIFPLCWMTPWSMGRDFVHNCKHGILQYTVVRPLTTFIAFVCEIKGVYGEGRFDTGVAFPYIIFINNCSQFVAMYCLVLFYKANRDELKPMKPIPKFLCIKAVVFFSFFQGVIINFLVYFGFIKNIFGSEETDNYQLLSSKLQNFLICIEMFLAALAHHYSFPHKPFNIIIPHFSRQQNNSSWYSALWTMLDLSDVRQDVSEHIGVVGSSLSRRLRGRSTYQMPREATVSESINNTEREYLVQPSGSKTNLNSGDNYQSGLSIAGNQHVFTTKSNKYGAIDTGINIVKPILKKEYSPNEGAPKVPNIFKFNDPKNANTLIIGESPSFSDLHTFSSKSDDTIPTTNTDTANRGSDNTSSSQSNLLKSDSNNSDWLSTPDEILGIDVKGVSNDKINYNPDRKA